MRALLAFLGAAAGVALAWKASAMLLNMATPGPDPVPLSLAPDFRVLAFTLGVTVLKALLFVAVTAVAVMTIAAAWLPARRATKVDPLQALRTE